MRCSRRYLALLTALCCVGVVVCFSGDDSLTARELALLGTWRRVDARDDRENGLRVVFAEKQWSRLEILNVCSKMRKTYFRTAFWHIEDDGFFWSDLGPAPRTRTAFMRPVEVILGFSRRRASYRSDLGRLEFVSRDRIRITHPEWMLDSAEFERVTDLEETDSPPVQIAGK